MEDDKTNWYVEVYNDHDQMIEGISIFKDEWEELTLTDLQHWLPHLNFYAGDKIVIKEIR